MTVEHDRSAALLIRVWLEGRTDEFRGRLTSVSTSLGDGGVERTVAVASLPEAVLEAVGSWLAQFTGGAPGSGDGG
ncbi:hypothetical protein [Modestobacter sp. DSM 44400]|uniref:hypothetical protein n=1 Tax=Modestobacter sp. DSM 44400 TaxID=1550230 RepID=UPI000B81CF38|nr:hypothetical protein [Modestobacter sp. DSM 44400]